MKCSSHSDPNVANAFYGRSRKKVVDEHQRTASSSPEHPLSRVRGRSMLGDKQQGNGVAVSRYLSKSLLCISFQSEATRRGKF